MFNLHSLSVGSEAFGGLIDIKNKDRLLSFLSGVSKNAEYLIYEYDMNGNPYHEGKPKVLRGSDLSRLALWCHHVSHQYQIRNISGIILCSVSFGYTSPSRSTPERVAKILH